MFVKYTRDWWNQGTPSLAGAEWGEDGFPAVDSNWTQPSNLVTLRLSRTIGTSAVNDFQFSYAGNRINHRKRRNQSDPGFADLLKFDASLSVLAENLRK